MGFVSNAIGNVLKEPAITLAQDPATTTSVASLFSRRPAQQPAQPAQPAQDPWATALAKYGITDPYNVKLDKVTTVTPVEHQLVIGNAWDEGMSYKTAGYYDANNEFVRLTPEEVSNLGDKTTFTTYDKKVTNYLVNPSTGKSVPIKTSRLGESLGGKDFFLYGTDDMAYRVKFGDDGTPQYYAIPVQHDSGGFLSDFAPVLAIAGAFVAPGLGSTIAAGLGVPAYVGTAIASTALQVAAGVDPEKAIKNAITGAVIQTGSAAVASEINTAIKTVVEDTKLAASISNAATSALASGAITAVKGGSQDDIIQSALAGAVGSATTSATGEAILGKAVSGAITGGAEGALKSAANAFASSSGLPGPSKADIDPNTFEKILGSIDPSTYGLVDLNKPEEPYTPTTDFGFTADYSLASPKLTPTLEEMGGAQGIKAPELPDVFTPDGTIDYSLFSPTKTGGEPALTMPKTPNLESMGGGQGLTMPVEGGTMTEAGLIPDDYTASLGDPNSFINKPAPGGDVSDAVQKAINASDAAQKAVIAPSGASKNASDSGAKPAKSSATSQAGGMDLLSTLGLMGLLGGGGTTGGGVTPIYGGEMQPFDFEAPLDVGFFSPKKEKQTSQPGQQATKIASGGYLDDLLDLLR